MRKYDEGYALPFVLVVMVVLCLVAASLMTGSLRNLKSQQASIERMQDQYKAQGAIEKVVAQLEDESNLSNLSGDDAAKVIKDKIASICNNIYNNGEAANPNANPADNPLVENEEAQTFEYKFKLTSIYGKSQIECDLKLAGKIVKEGTMTVPVTYTYTITEPTVDYETYKISSYNSAEGGAA